MKSLNPVKSTKSTTDMPHPYSKPVIPVKSLNLVKSTKSTTDMPHPYSQILNKVSEFFEVNQVTYQNAIHKKDLCLEILFISSPYKSTKST